MMNILITREACHLPGLHKILSDQNGLIEAGEDRSYQTLDPNPQMGKSLEASVNTVPCISTL